MIIDEKSPIPKYYQLQIWLKEQIEQGFFKANDKIPTEEELVRDLHLSRATIKHAIQNLVDKGYLIRKKKFGTFVNPAIHDNGNDLRIGLLLNFYKSGFGIELIRGAADRASEHRCQLVLGNTFDVHIQAEEQCRRLIDWGIDGVVYVPTAASDDNNRSIIQSFQSHKIPVVIADRFIPNLEVDSVVTDNFNGAYKLVKYIIEKGHRKIAIVINTLLNTARDRLAGYKQALIDAHLPIDSHLIFTIDEHSSDENYLDIAHMVLTQKKTFTAIFAENDKIAQSICTVAPQYGIVIPKDLSIAGYDDIPMIENGGTALTTVHQPLYEMGQNAIDLLLKRIKGDTSETKTILLHSHLVERNSVLPL